MGATVGLLSNYLATPAGIYFFYSGRLYYLAADQTLSDLGAESTGRMLAMGEKLVLFKAAEIAVYDKLVKTTFANPTATANPDAIANIKSNRIIFGTNATRLHAITNAGLVTSPSLDTGVLSLVSGYYGEVDRDYFMKADRLYTVDANLNVSMVSYPEPLDYMDQVKGVLYFQSKSDFSFSKFTAGTFTALGFGHTEKLSVIKREATLNEFSDPHIIMAMKIDTSDPDEYVFSYYELHTGKNELNLIESYAESTLTGNWLMSYLRESVRLLGKLYPSADYVCSLSSY